MRITLHFFVNYTTLRPSSPCCTTAMPDVSGISLKHFQSWSSFLHELCTSKSNAHCCGSAPHAWPLLLDSGEQHWPTAISVAEGMEEKADGWTRLLKTHILKALQSGAWLRIASCHAFTWTRLRAPMCLLQVVTIGLLSCKQNLCFITVPGIRSRLLRTMPNKN